MRSSGTLLQGIFWAQVCDSMSDSGSVRQRPGFRWAGISRFVAVALALHIPLFIYPVARVCGWLDLSWWLTCLLVIPVASSQIVSRVYLRRHQGPGAGVVRLIANLLLGASPLMLFSVLLMEIPVWTGLVTASGGAMTAIGIAGAGTAVGVATAMFPVVRRVQLKSSKLTSPIRFVQLTDVHIGSRRRGFLERVIDQVNRLEPDFLCITGDFIDESGIPATELRSLKSVVGPIYFSIGNHEKYEDLADIEARLTSLGVNVLRARSMNHAEQVQVIGIDDMDDAGQVGRCLAGLEVMRDRFVVLLYHRPRGLVAAAEAGVDLMLSGHTHNGQIVPFNLIVRRVFDMTRGLYREGGCHLYVSEGTGTWGPTMRLGTRAEITLFEVLPESGQVVRISQTGV